MTVENLLNILREYDRDIVVRVAIERAHNGEFDMRSDLEKRGISGTTSDWPYLTLYAPDPTLR